ncbi:peptide methionine sulfoxide reductase-like [Vigna radiata var. radiata]|uniref:peptide-methionine (S)-S-oxide reductase n=1 Tax=Vigna radiata var. radiata TaxID=3916 RepID=A0A1S3U604_VIGRR|nr:peptide methionine sulfoxide reductase-like [Vigna radiata var. radiata]
MAATGGGEAHNNPALQPDLDIPDTPDLQFAEFGSGCFWGAELAFQRIVGVVKTEVGYTQGHTPDPDYKLVCTGTTNHVEVVRVQFDPKVSPYTDLLALFWSRHDPTSINRQGNDVGAQYRSGIYYYDEEQARLAQESKEAKQLELKEKIVTEILPAKRFYKAEDYHQQYLEKGGGKGESNKQSAEKGCTDPIRCYG